MPDNVPTSPTSTDVSYPESREIHVLRERLRRKWRLKVLPSDVCDTRAFHAHLNKLLEPNDALWEEQIFATWIVGRADLNAEQKAYAVQALSSVLSNPPDMRRKRRLSRWSRGLFRSTCTMAGVGVVGVLLWLISFLLNKEIGIGLSTSAMLFAVIAGGVAGAMLGIVFHPLLMPIWSSIDNVYANRVRRSAAIALGRLQQPESVGVLALGAVDGHASVRRASAEALSVVLHLLTPEHYGKLEADAVPNLCRALNRQAYFPLEMTTLTPEFLFEALEKVGDGRAVKTVLNLAEQGLTRPTREAATRLLSILLERQRKENEAQMLLRGSEIPSVAPEQLLRPASNAVSDASEVLLRPAGTNE
ncbi:MAG TPA: hypothetical protein VKU00_03995 [Chthonomonadaceae bacterium]|nr:hypothetical protein [Chthonomonadaceae bacterium]